MIACCLISLNDSLRSNCPALWAQQAGEDPGGYALLGRYQQRRQQDQQATIGVTDGLIRLFANRYGPLVVGRNLGLMAMAQLPSVRDAFAKRTLGWVDR